MAFRSPEKLIATTTGRSRGFPVWNWPVPALDLEPRKVFDSFTSVRSCVLHMSSAIRKETELQEQFFISLIRINVRVHEGRNADVSSIAQTGLALFSLSSIRIMMICSWWLISLSRSPRWLIATSSIDLPGRDIAIANHHFRFHLFCHGVIVPEIVSHFTPTDFIPWWDAEPTVEDCVFSQRLVWDQCSHNGLFPPLPPPQSWKLMS